MVECWVFVGIALVVGLILFWDEINFSSKKKKKIDVKQHLIDAQRSYIAALEKNRDAYKELSETLEEAIEVRNGLIEAQRKQIDSLIAEKGRSEKE